MNRLWELGKKRWWYFFNVGLGVIYGVDLFFLKDPDETKWDNIIDGFLCVFHIALFFVFCYMEKQQERVQREMEEFRSQEIAWCEQMLRSFQYETTESDIEKIRAAPREDLDELMIDITTKKGESTNERQ